MIAMICMRLLLAHRSRIYKSQMYLIFCLLLLLLLTIIFWFPIQYYLTMVKSYWVYLRESCRICANFDELCFEIFSDHIGTFIDMQYKTQMVFANVDSVQNPRRFTAYVKYLYSSLTHKYLFTMLFGPRPCSVGFAFCLSFTVRNITKPSSSFHRNCMFIYRYNHIK